MINGLILVKKQATLFFVLFCRHHNDNVVNGELFFFLWKVVPAKSWEKLLEGQLILVIFRGDIFKTKCAKTHSSHHKVYVLSVHVLKVCSDYHIFTNRFAIVSGFDFYFKSKVRYFSTNRFCPILDMLF